MGKNDKKKSKYVSAFSCCFGASRRTGEETLDASMLGNAYGDGAGNSGGAGRGTDGSTEEGFELILDASSVPEDKNAPQGSGPEKVGPEEVGKKAEGILEAKDGETGVTKDPKHFDNNLVNGDGAGNSAAAGSTKEGSEFVLGAPSVPEDKNAPQGSGPEEVGLEGVGQKAEGIREAKDDETGVTESPKHFDKSSEDDVVEDSKNPDSKNPHPDVIEELKEVFSPEKELVKNDGENKEDDSLSDVGIQLKDGSPKESSDQNRPTLVAAVFREDIPLSADNNDRSDTPRPASSEPATLLSPREAVLMSPTSFEATLPSGLSRGNSGVEMHL